MKKLLHTLRILFEDKRIPVTIFHSDTGIAGNFAAVEVNLKIFDKSFFITSVLSISKIQSVHFQ